jgi:hypothetical protein
MQAFSADLQALLAQSGGNAGTAATSAATGADATASSTNQTASSQAPGAVHHHHHHHSDGSGDGSGSLSTDQINQSASVFATDVMQALQSYGTTTRTASGPSILA